ncbi:MAG TPA: hypothetical protein VJ722_11275, partial [Rhodanobacteraceae bacterium]|nr:hypothetical protein [Rhodanobacteraceae bacterium]
MSKLRFRPLAFACCVLLAGSVGLSACSQPSGSDTTPASSASAAAPAKASTASTATASADIKDNPFYSASTLPFQAPPFDRIKDSDYQPAIEEGMHQQQAEI